MSADPDNNISADPDNNITVAQAIINEGIYIALATSAVDGTPWCSPVFYGVTPDLTFILISSIRSRHATNIRESGKASWAVYWGAKSPEETDGVMFGGFGREVTQESEALKYGNILYDQRFPNVDERAEHPVHPAEWGKTGRRIYLLTPNEAYKVDKDDPYGVSRSLLRLEALRGSKIIHPFSS